jgi:hypothetical protein
MQSHDINQPLLEISTLAPRRKHILIDGKPYFFAIPEADFGAQELATLEGYRNRIAQLQENGAPPATLLDLIDEISGRFLRLILLDLPDDVLAKISRDNRLAIIQVFTQVAGPTRTATPRNRADRRAAARTGVRSSPDSRNSTVATRSDGSTLRPASSPST